MSDFSGAAFRLAEVAGLYSHRPPYASQVYCAICEHTPGFYSLVDLGSGEGKIARPLAKIFGQVVAVDPSARMISLGTSLENGRADNLTWIEATAEDAPLQGRFDVATFASSIHWMDPDMLFTKLKRHMMPDHLLAFVARDEAFEPPWDAEWQAFLAKWVPRTTGHPLGSKTWSNTRDRHLAHIEVIKTQDFVSDPFQQSVDGFIKCQHSRNSFALSKFKEPVAHFRQDLRDILAPHANSDGQVTYRVKTRVTLATLKL